MGKRNSILLTRDSVKALEAKHKRYYIWDKDLPGFGVRVERKSGVKTFLVVYRTQGGGRSAPKRMMTIGRLGVWAADSARKQAKVLLGGAASGTDPAAELQAKRKAMLVGELIDLYDKEGCFIQRGKRQGQPMKPDTKRNTINRLRNHIIPLLGKRRANELNAGDMEKMVADITAGKTAKDEHVAPRKRVIVRGGAGGASKVFCDLSAVFSFALRREIVDRNPCATAAVRRTGNSKDRFLTLEELSRLGKALSALEREERVNHKAIDIARLWALTGCRHEEIAALKWSEVNQEEGYLILDDSKTGKSKRPLGAAALTLLANIRKRRDHADKKDEKAVREKNSVYVFPAERGDNHFQGTSLYWDKAIEKAKLPGVTPHTLRHTMGSTAVSHGEALMLTGAILGHSNPRSTAIYAHVQMDPSKRAANRVTKKIAAALSGDASPGKAKKAKTGKKLADNDLLKALQQRLAAGGPEAEQLRQMLSEAA